MIEAYHPSMSTKACRLFQHLEHLEHVEPAMQFRPSPTFIVHLQLQGVTTQ